MKIKSTALLLLLVATLSIEVLGQTTISQKDMVSLTKSNWTLDQIDSLLPTVRKYFYESDFEKVVELTPSLIERATELGDYTTASRLKSVLGNAFISLDDIDGAFRLFDESLMLSIQKKDTLEIINSYLNLGNTYFYNDAESSINYFEKGLFLAEKASDIKDYSAFFIANNNLAELYVREENATKAQLHINKAKEYLNHEGLEERKAEYLSGVNHVQGSIFSLQGKPQEAIDKINQSLKIGKGKIDENYLINSYKILMKSYDQLGSYREVNEIRKIYEPLVNKRYEAEKIRQQKIATSRFNLDIYKQELRALQLENEIAIQKAAKNNLLLKTSYGIAGILLLLLGLLLYVRYKRNKLLADLKMKNKQYLAAKEKSEKLAKSNTKFLSTISHELRTPLYGIIGLSSVFLDDPKLKSHTDDLNSLKFSADYLLALVNDVLNLNKFSSKEGEQVHKSNFKLKQLVPQIVQSFEFINKKNNNSLAIQIDSEIPEVLLGDKTKISQVLMNLVSNASKFTEDGNIIVQAQLKDKDSSKVSILFNITDTGQGIPKDDQANIFKEFTQVETYTVQQGTGLGLPIVNKILNLLGSKLSLESEPNVGSTFYFLLTLDIGSEDAVETQIDLSGYGKLKAKRILIVDDNKINQVVSQKVLEQHGIEHKTASDGAEAVAAVKEGSFDAILMDINMPVMNGIDASIAIRTFDTSTPIIALTATNYKKGSNELENYGINDSIVKPYKTEDLLTILQEQIA